MKAVPEKTRRTRKPVLAEETAQTDKTAKAPENEKAAEGLTPADVAEPMSRQTEQSLVEELLADPTRTPEILAFAAVERWGPRAQDWAQRTRAVYPTATPEAVARLAVQRFTRAAGLRGVAGALAGPYSPIVVTVGILVTHAELVLHVAAAFGVDPADPRRAEDLLNLASPGPVVLGPIVAGLLLKRALPGFDLVSAVLAARSTAESVAVRATRFYRESQLSQAAGSSA